MHMQGVVIRGGVECSSDPGEIYDTSLCTFKQFGYYSEDFFDEYYDIGFNSGYSWFTQIEPKLDIDNDNYPSITIGEGVYPHDYIDSNGNGLPSVIDLDTVTTSDVIITAGIDDDSDFLDETWGYRV